MAANEAITKADLASGVNLARAEGVNRERVLAAGVREGDAERAKFMDQVKKSRKKAITGDIAMLAAVVAPWAIPALGSALGIGQAGAAASGTAAAHSSVAALKAADVAGHAAGSGLGAKVVGLAKNLQPYALPLASTVGNLAGSPSEPASGGAALLNDVMNRRTFNTDLANPRGALPGETEIDRIRRLRGL